MHRHLLVIAAGVFGAALSVSGQEPIRSLPAASAPRTAGAPNAARTAPAPRPVGAARSVDPRILPGTSDSAFSTVQGNALNTNGGSLPNATVRLRDARSGQIVATQVTDENGVFMFESVDPGSYIVEVLGNDGTALAATQLLNVNAGEAVSAVVKLPFRIPPFAGFLGHTATSAIAVGAAAASAELLGVAANECASPPGDCK